MKSSFALLSCLLAEAVLAAPSASTFVVHEKRDVDNERWIKREALHPDSRVPVRIAMKQRNLDKGMDYLLDVSDPASTNYGKYYSQEQIAKIFGPETGSVDSVKRWLVESGIDARKINVPRSNAWVEFQSTVGELESLLATRFHAYDHVEARNAHIGTDEYHLPRDISEIVEFVTPGVVFSSTRAPSKAMQRRSAPPKQSMIQPLRPLTQLLLDLLENNPLSDLLCGALITPHCIKKMYGIPDGTSANPANRLGIFEYYQDIYAQGDLDEFYLLFGQNIPIGTGPKVDLIDGATAPTSQATAGGESDLDFELAIPLLYPQGTELYETYVNNDDIFNTFLDAIDGSYCGGDDPTVDGVTPNEMCGTFKPTNVISFSYGTAEADYPTPYLKRQCDEFMKLGLQGTSIVFASGDDGVARRSGPCLGSKKNIFTPGQQASCPYVTSVGSTTLPLGSMPGDAETATTRFSSGGGFSNIWTTPDYQKDAVATYFSQHDPGYPSYNTSDGNIPDNGGIYNRAGRGYPDVAAVGDNIAVVVMAAPNISGGTSASCPIMASIFTRINEERLKAGKPTIGFANPALYKNPSMFKDVTTGNQDKGGPGGDGNPSACGNNGFSAVKGWDPVTGLGTPNYPAMLSYFMSM